MKYWVLVMGMLLLILSGCGETRSQVVTKNECSKDFLDVKVNNFVLCMEGSTERLEDGKIDWGQHMNDVSKCTNDAKVGLSACTDS